MDASCKIQGGIHFFFLVHNMCPELWVHIKIVSNFWGTLHSRQPFFFISYLYYKKKLLLNYSSAKIFFAISKVLATVNSQSKASTLSIPLFVNVERNSLSVTILSKPVAISSILSESK